MRTVAAFLGLVLGLAGCTPAHVTRPHDGSEARDRSFPHSFVRDHGTAPSFEPATRRVLSAQDASLFAAQLANEQCERQYHRRPFKPEQYPATLQDGVYHWGELDIGGPGGFSASVTFNPDGKEPHVEIYYSSDALGLR